MAYETPSASSTFNSTVFIEIEDYLDLKIKAIKSHVTQNIKNYMKADAIEGLAKFRGQQAMIFKPVEAFSVYKLIL